MCIGYQEKELIPCRRNIYRRGGIRKRKDDRWEGHYDRAM